MANVKMRREEWIPDADTGAGFTPGYWRTIEAEGAAGDLTAVATAVLSLAPGESLSFWRDADD